MNRLGSSAVNQSRSSAVNRLRSSAVNRSRSSVVSVLPMSGQQQHAVVCAVTPQNDWV